MEGLPQHTTTVRRLGLGATGVLLSFTRMMWLNWRGVPLSRSRSTTLFTEPLIRRACLMLRVLRSLRMVLVWVPVDVVMLRGRLLGRAELLNLSRLGVRRWQLGTELTSGF